MPTLATSLLQGLKDHGAIIVDVEIRRYGPGDRVTALARKLGLPVVPTFMGLGLLEQAPDTLLGTCLDAAADPAITEMVEEADALVLLCVIFSDTNFAAVASPARPAADHCCLRSRGSYWPSRGFTHRRSNRSPHRARAVN